MVVVPPAAAAPGAGEKIVGDDGAHHRQLQMGVRVDAARHDEAACGLDDFGSGRRRQSLADRGDPPIAAQHIGPPPTGLAHHRAAADQRLHFLVP